MVEIEIDGKALAVAEGSTIIEAADDAGIYIPRFCYHKKLSVAANCRMCLVEVEKVGKPLPACATPVTEGMKVFTRSQKAIQAQRGVMEFLLINHPLDCPICDQGGECELQDLSMGYGHADSNYCEPKRSVASEDLGPLIETWMTRCIHCTRCVRFGEEVAGLRELGVTGRGEDSEIGTYVKHFMRSELSGNIIDICPVGALTNKPARYEGRAWEYWEHASVSPHDMVGSNMFVHTRGRILKPERFVMRAAARENEHINETWLSDRDRFSVHGLYDSSRVYKPRIKQNGQWVEVEWQRAIDELVDRTRAIASERGADQLAAVVSPNSTVEEQFLMQKLMRALGSDNIDHRMREQDFSDQEQTAAFPQFEPAIAEVEHLNAILLVGSNIRYEQPMLGHRINKAAQEGAAVMAVNPMDYEFCFAMQEKIIVEPNQLLDALTGIAKVLASEMNESIAELAAVTPSEISRTMAAKLLQADASAIFVGEHGMGHPDAAQVRALVQLIGRLSKSKVGFLTSGANGAGAWLTGCVPHRGSAGATVEKPGLTAQQFLGDQAVRGYFILNTEPEFDCAQAYAAIQALESAGLVVCLTPFSTPAMESYADFILPIAPFTETAGTFVNAEGKWQSYADITVPHQDAKPAWKVLRVIANFLELDGFDYKTVHEVQFDIKHQVEKMAEHKVAAVSVKSVAAQAEAGLYRLAPWPMYRVDNLVRRSKPLQQTMTEEEMAIAVNTNTAAQHNLSAGEQVTAVQGESQLTLPLMINDRLADNTVWLPSGLPQTAGFGEAEKPIQLQRESH